MMKKSLVYAVCGVVALGVSACTPVQNGYYNAPNMNGAYNANMASNQPMPAHAIPPQARQQMAANGYAPQMDAANEKVVNDVNVLRERLRRLERAMVRLDRRMQLIERNELSRMSGSAMEGGATPPAQGAFQPMSYNKQSAPLPALAPVPTPRAQGNQARFQPVAYGQPQQADSRITSSLGVAPKQAPMPVAQQRAQRGLAGLPSLADSNEDKKEHNVSIWTISYENGKVWPNRNQLPSSRDVIESLNSGEPVALFARGAKPSSKEFRERVRAISKYLSKVTDIDNLPIASMSAKHLDGDTIELLATQ